MFMNEGPPTDIELALFMIQQKERQRNLHHMHQQQQEEMQRRVENPPPGIQYCSAKVSPCLVLPSLQQVEEVGPG